jgi:hypothetical protein
LDAGEASIFLRAPGGAEAAVMLGPGPGGSGGLLRSSKGNVEQAPLAAARIRMDRPLGQWNEMTIAARGDKISVTLNGSELFPAVPMAGLASGGWVGLHSRFGHVQFRGMLVKDHESVSRPPPK